VARLDNLLFGGTAASATEDVATAPPVASTDIESLIEKHSATYGLDPNFAKAIIYQESGFDPSAESAAGAAGLGQFMPKTWEGVAAQLGEEPGDRFDADTNAKYTVFHLSDLQKKLGSQQAAAAAHKAGEGAVRKAGGVPQRSQAGGFDPFVNETTQDYVDKIMTHLQLFEGGGRVSPRKVGRQRTEDRLSNLLFTGKPPIVAPQAAEAPQPAAEPSGRIPVSAAPRRPLEEQLFATPTTPSPEEVQPQAATDVAVAAPELQEQPKAMNFDEVDKILRKKFGKNWIVRGDINEDMIQSALQESTGLQIRDPRGMLDVPEAEKAALPEGAIALPFDPTKQDFSKYGPQAEDVRRKVEAFYGSSDAQTRALALQAIPQAEISNIVKNLSIKERKEILTEADNIRKEGQTFDAFAYGVLNSTPIPAFLPEESKEAIGKVSAEHPIASTAGQITGTVAQALVGGSAIGGVLSKAPLLQKSALLRTALTRMATTGAITAGQNLGRKDFGEAVKDIMQGQGAALVSIVPEVLLPANSWQLIGQPLADLMYDAAVDAARGRDVGSADWWKKEVVSLAIAEGFAIKDVASGKVFKADQLKQRGELKKVLETLRGKKIEVAPPSKVVEGDFRRITDEQLIERFGMSKFQSAAHDDSGFDTRQMRKQLADEISAGTEVTPKPPEEIPIAAAKVPEPTVAKEAPKPEPELAARVQAEQKPKGQPLKAAEIPGEIESVRDKVDFTAPEKPSKSFDEGVAKTVKFENKPVDAAEQKQNLQTDKESGEFLNKIERLYAREKEAAFPITKAQKIFEKEAGVKLKPEENLQFKIDAVRGSGGIAKQYVDDNLTPILKDLRINPKTKKKLTGAQSGFVSRDLENYLIAKRQKWLYENKSGYVDEGYTKEHADEVVNKWDSDKGERAELIKNKAKEIWNYTKKLKGVKEQFGIIDEELAEALKDPFYVPFYRDIEASRLASPIGGERFTTTSRGIKRIKGSKRGARIKNIYQNLIEYTNETIVNATRNDVFRGLIDLSGKSEKLSGLISKLPPRWRKMGRIEHRAEVDKVLAPQLDKLVSDLGGEASVKARTGKKLGFYKPKTGRMTMMFGASESSKAHELGHLIDEDVTSLKGLVNKHAEEFTAVAEARYQGEEVSQKYIRYANQADEKAAEFVAMYVSDRSTLVDIAPNAVAEFEAKMSKHPQLKRLKDMVPTRVKGIDKYEEDNWVMDQSIPRDDDVISGFIGGKMEHYRVPRELAVAVKNLNPQQINPILRIIAAPTAILRKSAVSMNIDFFIPNVMRDQINTAFHSKNIPGLDLTLGAKHYIAQDDLYKQYMRMGGAMDSPESGIRQLKSSADDLVYGSKHGKFLDPDYWKEHGVAKTAASLAGYAVSSPFRGISSLAELSEMSTRLGVFGRELKGGKDVREAIHAGRQASLDFQRFGSGGIVGGRIPNSVIPFINAALEGVDRMGRSAYQNPKRFAMAAFTYGYAPTIGLLAWNQQNRNYKNISDREKANNYIIMKGQDSQDYWKIPKSHAVKLVVNPFQLAYERAQGTSEGDWKDVASAALSSVSPIDNVGTVVPTALKLLVEPIANYDFYWNQVIEPETLRRIAKPGQRYKKGTSETLKTVGRALNFSPIVMQHEINTLFSGLGRHSLTGLDWALGATGVQKPATITEDRIPILRRFSGKTETWKSEVAKHMREIDSSVRRIERLSEKSLIKYNGYSPREARKVLVETKKYKQRLERKQVELAKANNALDVLLDMTKKAEKRYGK